MSTCVFCQIVQGKAPATVVWAWEDAVAFVPLGPVVEEEHGHVLVVPRTHVEDFTTNPEVTAATSRRAAELGAKLRAAGRDLNLITSAGPAATQTVRHLHVHVVTRRAEDGLHLPWTGQKKG
ncbi:HIT family protein [Promicromonospora sp. NFX87]|uniref:HIT family protein n=1 Tax=Promicromonospora sp. NFX87 TaxID=3402691 RepID=UPI003AFAB6F8